MVYGLFIVIYVRVLYYKIFGIAKGVPGFRCFVIGENMSFHVLVFLIRVCVSYRYLAGTR